MDSFPSSVTGLFPIYQEWRVVISSHRLILVNIDSFIGGDREIINRRLGEKRKVSLCFSSFFWFGKDPRITVLWVGPAKFIWFYQGSSTPRSSAACRTTFQVQHGASAWTCRRHTEAGGASFICLYVNWHPRCFRRTITLLTLLSSLLSLGWCEN